MDLFEIKLNGRKECDVRILSDEIHIVFYDKSKGILRLETLGQVAEIIDDWRDKGHNVVIHERNF
jgi:hypothetical protein